MISVLKILSVAAIWLVFNFFVTYVIAMKNDLKNNFVQYCIVLFFMSNIGVQHICTCDLYSNKYGTEQSTISITFYAALPFQGLRQKLIILAC